MSTLEPTRMRFFTRRLEGVARAEAETRYRAYLAALAPSPPAAALELAYQGDTHDALFQKARWNPGARVLEFLLRAGSEQTGFFDLLLRYHGAQIRFPVLAELEHLVENPETCVRDLEFGQDGDSWTHRWLLDPAGEVEIAFTDLHVGRLAHANRFFETPVERFEIVSC